MHIRLKVLRLVQLNVHLDVFRKATHTVLELVQRILGAIVGGKFELVEVGRSQAAEGGASGAPRYDDAPGHGTPNG
jgi:hypothetical protein